jgi:hypothetical protein
VLLWSLSAPHASALRFVELSPGRSAADTFASACRVAATGRDLQAHLPTDVPIPRTILGASLTTVVAVAAGCGGSGSSNPGPASVPRPAAATPIANTAESASPLIRTLSAGAQYAGFAHAVNLRPGDVPGFIAAPKKPKHVHLHNKAFEDEAQYRRCFNIGKQTKAALKASSDKFTLGGGLHSQSVSSEVEIAPTIATTQRELKTTRRALSDPASRRCLARVFDALGSQSQAMQMRGGALRVTVGNLQLVPFQVDSVTRGTDGGFGLSLTMTVTYTAFVRGRTLTIPAPLQLDVLAFAVGRGEVTLTTTTLGASFPPELEARLFSLLVSRARTASLAYPTIRK